MVVVNNKGIERIFIASRLSIFAHLPRSYRAGGGVVVVYRCESMIGDCT